MSKNTYEKKIMINGTKNRYHMKKITGGIENQQKTTRLGINNELPEYLYEHNIQQDIISFMKSKIISGSDIPIQYIEVCEYLHNHIQTKIQSYITQDKIKKRKITDKFITKNDIIQKLFNSKLKCHYCCESVNILYLAAREMTQWTLDRLDNNEPHNCDNVVISCLGCNLKKGKRGEDDFIFTKQLNIIKKEDDEINEIVEKNKCYEENIADTFNPEEVHSNIEYSYET